MTEKDINKKNRDLFDSLRDEAIELNKKMDSFELRGVVRVKEAREYQERVKNTLNGFTLNLVMWLELLDSTKELNETVENYLKEVRIKLNKLKEDLKIYE